MATVAENLQAAAENMALAVRVQTANWTAAGCPPTFTIDGEQYEWNDWLAKQMEGLKKLTDQIAATDPFEINQIGYV